MKCRSSKAASSPECSRCCQVSTPSRASAILMKNTVHVSQKALPRNLFLAWLEEQSAIGDKSRTLQVEMRHCLVECKDTSEEIMKEREKFSVEIVDFKDFWAEVKCTICFLFFLLSLWCLRRTKGKWILSCMLKSGKWYCEQDETILKHVFLPVSSKTR